MRPLPTEAGAARSGAIAVARWAVELGERRLGLGRRRAPMQVLPWPEVAGLGLSDLAVQPQGAGQLLMLFDTMRPADIAATVRDLPLKRRHEVADAMDDERLADVIEELPDDDQKELLAYLAEERAADLLAELAPAEQSRLLELMEPEESAPVRRLLEYSSDTAGGLMTPEPVVLTPDTTIAEAPVSRSSTPCTSTAAAPTRSCSPKPCTPTPTSC